MTEKQRELFSRVSFVESYYEKMRKFFSSQFDSEEEMCSFFEKVFLNDMKDSAPRRMMNQVERWVSLARKCDLLGNERDSIRVLCIRCCIESLSKLSEGKNRKKADIQSSFFEDNLRDEDKEYIKNNLFIINEIHSSEKERKSSSFVLDQVFFFIRNGIVHAGDNWSTEVFNENPNENECSFCVVDSGRSIEYETTLSYSEFEKIFVTGCIRFIEEYCDLSE